MRLFIAINLDSNALASIRTIQDRLKTFATAGNFVPRENLHMTLAFLGEQNYSRIPVIENILSTMENTTFPLVFTHLGFFKRGGFLSRSSDEGDLWWLGVREEKALLLLQKRLFTALWENGFQLENREFMPHITLGRKIILEKDFPGKNAAEDLFPIETLVTRLSLMKSEQSRGKIMYTEIFGQDFTAGEEHCD